ncbi:MAG: hypothetical protein WAQ98_21205 [Blastocatellia bacterium]
MTPEQENKLLKQKVKQVLAELDSVKTKLLHNILLNHKLEDEIATLKRKLLEGKANAQLPTSSR